MEEGELLCEKEKGKVEDGHYMWYCSIADVPCTQSTEWTTFLSFTTDEERARILRFRLEDDRKRALVSLLLQKALIRHHLGITSNDGYCIQRTAENKPYMLLISGGGDTEQRKPERNWNYNLSHHGQFVGIASHQRFLVGADVVDINTRSPSIKSARDYVDVFERNLARKEFDFISNQPDEESKYTAFFVTWSLKESYIKAIGLGLGFELQNICFSIKYSSNDKVDGRNSSRMICGTASAEIHQETRKDWSFEFFSIDSHHIMAVALGPIRDAILSYRLVAFPEVASSEGDTFSNPLTAATAACDPSSFAVPPEPRLLTVFSLLTDKELSLYRKACFLPSSHVKGNCEICTPPPFPTIGPTAFIDSDYCVEMGYPAETDELISGTPIPRTPITLPRTPVLPPRQNSFAEEELCKLTVEGEGDGKGGKEAVTTTSSCACCEETCVVC